MPLKAAGLLRPRGCLEPSCIQWVGVQPLCIGTSGIVYCHCKEPVLGFLVLSCSKYYVRDALDAVMNAGQSRATPNFTPIECRDSVLKPESGVTLANPSVKLFFLAD